MSKLLFVPFSIVSGLIAGFAARRLFDALWGLVDEEEPPASEHRDTNWPKLTAALALEGAVFRVTSGVVDRAARLSFYRATGAWPGEQAPEPTDDS